MSTVHHPNQVHSQHSRPLRCLRHHVSMAACEDCRYVRTAQIQRERTRADSAG
ncbi:hypothetical protein [Blastococcus colisei]|uniref:hypothetical protein n=1 Tax=Blastococcus colisei TaxID=1564162 RepID=UPI001477711D|nr:hypothetical protein [Blastococcus colisei]